MLNFLYAFDENYNKQGCVSIFSLLENTPSSYPKFAKADNSSLLTILVFFEEKNWVILSETITKGYVIIIITLIIKIVYLSNPEH